MIIKIQEIYLQNQDYQVFEPKQDGEVELKKIAKLWKMTEEEAKTEVKNHPCFVVENSQTEAKKSK